MKRKWNKMYQNGQKELTYWQFPDKHIAGISSSSNRLYKRQPRPRRWLTQLPSGRDLAHTDQLQYADATIHMGAARTLPAPHSPPPEGFVLLPRSLPMKPPNALRCQDGLWTRVPHVLEMPALSALSFLTSICLVSLVSVVAGSRAVTWLVDHTLHILQNAGFAFTMKSYTEHSVLEC